MLTSLRFCAAVIFTVQLVTTSCNEDNDVNPQLPDQPNPPVAPIARAGNDTTIYKPFNTCDFDGSASSDPDNRIVLFEWKFLKGPSTAYINGYDHNKAFASGLTALGDYEFELTVTDADRLSSKDTIVVTVAEPPCATPNKEVIIKDQKWVSPWFTEITIDIGAYLPANSYLKEIYIKRDTSDDWEFVIPLVDWDYDTNGLHSWVYYGALSIYPNQNTADDTPDVKIVYCQ